QGLVLALWAVKVASHRACLGGSAACAPVLELSCTRLAEASARSAKAIKPPRQARWRMNSRQPALPVLPLLPLPTEPYACANASLRELQLPHKVRAPGRV